MKIPRPLIYIGLNEDLNIWRTRAQVHASYLGLNSEFIQWRIEPSLEILLGYIHPGSSSFSPVPPKLLSSDDAILLKAAHGTWSLTQLKIEKTLKETTPILDSHSLWIALSGAEDNLYAWCGPLAIDQLYYRRDKNLLLISNDLRLLISPETVQLDPIGFYSLFQFGALSAPFTAFKNVRHIPPGHLVTFSLKHFSKQLLSHHFPDFHTQSLPSYSAKDELEKALINNIEEVPQNSGLFFSGGVDSGLLAALARRQGRLDLHLINCDLSPCLKTGVIDIEAKLAFDMATHLGYKLHVLYLTVPSIIEMLDRIGKDYVIPFGDASTIAMNQLVYFSKDILKSDAWVIDGTGADGIFLDTQPWRRINSLYRIPAVVRQFLSRFYQYESVFIKSGMISSWLGTINQTIRIPPLQFSVISKNKLTGIAFMEEYEIKEKVLQAQKDYIESLIDKFDDRMMISLFDIIWECIGIFAVKNFNLLRCFGLRPFYPFLNERVITAGAKIMEDRREWYMKKKYLKSLLARDVPHDMVYRPKSGFKLPLVSILRERKVKEYINHVVLVDDNPLNEFVYYATIKKLFKRIWDGNEIGKYHINFLWAYIFGSLWVRQLVKR